MGERIRQLRKSLKLTQAEFGKRIGLTGAWVSRAEINERNLTEQMIITVCRVYNVHEEWLRSGQGEMFLDEPKALLAALDDEDSLTMRDKAVVAGFLCLSPKDREGVANYLCRAAGFLNGKAIRVPMTVADRVAELDREEREAMERIRTEFAAKRADIETILQQETTPAEDTEAALVKRCKT